ncbi:HNH endonuclease [Chroococcidiopsis sp.]|uniref:HNH endonuclease n=1 Tax=Chroococcidiopsis sp. TaxID=3088168 RepID=UPI003F33F454
MDNFDTSKYFSGSLCKRNHNWNGTEQSLRYLSSKNCIQCHQKHYQENQEDIKKYASEHYSRNKERVNKQRRKYRAKKREYFRKYYARYYAANKESIKKYRADYRSKNKERVKLWIEKWEKSFKAKIANQRKRENRRKIKRNNYSFPYTSEQLKQRFKDFDNKCVYCGELATSIDHFIPLSKGGTDTLSNLVPACCRCNGRKTDFDPELWYKSQSFFSKNRWQNILRILGLSEATIGQLSLF